MYLAPAAPPVNTNSRITASYASEWLRGDKLMNWASELALDGTLTGAPPLVMTPMGWGRSYDAVSQLIAVTGTPLVNYPCTMLIRGVVPSDTTNIILSLSNNTVLNRHLILGIVANVPRLSVQNTSGAFVYGTTTPVVGSVVSMVGVLESVDNGIIYFNGKPEGNGPLLAFPAGLNRLAISGLIRTTTVYYAGVVIDAEVRTYAMSAAEIADWHADPWMPYRPTSMVFLTIPSGITLTVQDCLHNHAVDSPALTQAHTLAVADALHGHAVESVSLTQAHSLTAADTAHAHSVDSPALTQAHTLTASDTAHAHGVDSPALSQAHLLAVADAAHGHALEAVSLTQAHSLLAAGTAHSHRAEAITLSLAAVLDIADTVHAQAVESPTLTQVHSLSVADTTHGHAAESPMLIQAHVLSLQDASHSHTVEPVTLTVANILAVADTVHGHAADSPTLSQAMLLAVADALHAHSVDTLALTQANVLIVSNTLHAHLVDLITLFSGAITMPAGRVIVIRAAERFILIAGD